MRIGVDTGGTFTDCVVLRGARVEVLKVFSASTGKGQDAGGAVLSAIRGLAGKAAAPLSVIHGTTVGTNALLERRGARVALVTTAGFEDLIEIGRQNRARLYDLNPRCEPPLVPRALRIGVAERTAADGSVLRRLTPTALRALRAAVARSGADSIAICLLFSYVSPRHERAIARALHGLGLPLSVSHEILPEFREYERLSTTVINAYLAPRVGGYLGDFERGLRKQGKARLFVMQSSGGITTAARAAREPVRTILSGPAGGVVATAWLAQQLGLGKVISFDMGGTSTDVCLLDGGPRATRETTCAGLPVAVPVLDIHTVGAGGGSLARVDAGGALRVGPESAGAMPGPACYGRGGAHPAVTDAHVVLGRLDPGLFLGGSFRLDRAASERVFDDLLRRQPRTRGLKTAWRTREDLAAGVVAVGNATMEKALRVISVERGHDPREFSLVCFGGAGGLHAAELAGSLGLKQVIVPRNPGAFSALGVLLSDIVTDVSQSVLLPVPVRAALRLTPSAASISQSPSSFQQSLQTRFAALERHARAQLRRDGLEADNAIAEHRLDVRYHGQSYELTMPATLRFAVEFHRAHQQAYGYADPSRPLEIVSLRVRLTIRTPKLRMPSRRLRLRAGPRAALVRTAPVWFAGRFLDTSFYDRERLAPGTEFRGPAILTEYSSTIVVPPGFGCSVDAHHNLLLRPGRSMRR
jgi:N-methylhydantoinase A